MPNPLRIAIVGAGAVTSSVHLPILSRRRDLFTIMGLMDANAAAVDAIGERFGINESARFTDVDRMLAAPDLEAVLVLNSGSHAEFVMKALEAGKHVLCEKPLAYTQRELAGIRNALVRSGKLLTVGYMKTHDPAVRRAAELLKSDGYPHNVDVLVLHPSGDSQLATSDLSVDHPATPSALVEQFARSRRALQQEALGQLADHIGDLYSEVMLGSLIHELSVLRALGVHISGIDYVDRWAGHAAPSLLVHAHDDSSTRISMRWFYLDRFPEYQEEVRWVSEKASHHLLFSSPYFVRVPTRLTSFTSQGETKQQLVSTDYHSGFEVELSEFYEAVRTGEPSGSSIEDAAEDLRTCQRIAKFIADSEGLQYAGDLSVMQ